MKRILAVIAIAALALAMLTACSGGGLKDGTYRAEFDAPDSRGWTDFAEVTIKDGKITAVTADSAHTDGRIKTEDAAYKASYEAAGLGTYPEKFFGELEAQLVEKQDISKVDTIANATHSSVGFKTLVKALLDKNAKTGDTTTLLVPAITEG